MTGSAPPPEMDDGSRPVIDWLEHEGMRQGDPAAFIDALALRLKAAGLPLWRMTTGVPILHPQVDSSSILWEEGQPVSERRFRLDADGIRRLENSPMATVYAGGRVRCQLEGPSRPGEYPILADLRAEGVSDYLALPLRFSDGTWKGVTFATRRPGGFAEPEIALLESLSPILSMALEIRTLHRTMRTLLDTYVGPTAGGRVLDGAIKRGIHQRIEAVIWLCDLRGFTELSQRLGADEMVALLDDYFGAVTDAVSAEGGEVLKFIGDAVLAIFPLATADRPRAAARALAAARAMSSRIAGFNAERREAGRATIRLGLALHVGEVLYGNVGGSDRLDFTVIGQAVNLAARLEGLCKTLGREIVVSEEFAAISPEPLENLGRHALKGVDGERAVFGPISA